MKIRRLDHAALYVRDVEQSRRFYSQVLGMEEVARPSNFDFPGAWFRMDGTELHLIAEDAAGRVDELYPVAYNASELARGHGTHIAFEVEDLDEARLHLQELGVKIVGGPRPRGDGVQQLYVLDPDGYVVELFAWQR